MGHHRGVIDLAMEYGVPTRSAPFRSLGRRSLLTAVAGLGGLAVSPRAVRAGQTVDLGLPGGDGARAFTTGFPGKGRMILQRTRPPLLETPFEVFDKGIITPNDLFYVRWHWSNIPTQIDAASFRLRVHGQVERSLVLSLTDLLAMPSVELVAVNQCAGNSRGFLQPRVTGAQWGNGAMGNARWTGVRLKDVLDRAGVGAGAVAVRFRGLDGSVIPGGPDFMKSLSIDHARDGEVMIAYAMNGEQLPFLHGFPLRLVVPGWYATYWIKMLSDIEILDAADKNYWMTEAYRVPDNPAASVDPAHADVKMAPVARMNPRSFFTGMRSGDRAAADTPLAIRGIAFGGDAAVKRVATSVDNGRTWQDARLGEDAGKYGFRRWETSIAPSRGKQVILVRCTNTMDEEQPLKAGWNRGGFMRNVIESLTLNVT